MTIKNKGDFMEENILFDEEVEKLVYDEFKSFRKETLKLTKSQIFDKCYEIHIKGRIKKVILETGLLTKSNYTVLYRIKNQILEKLYQAFNEDLDATMNSELDTAAFIRAYCDNYDE